MLLSATHSSFTVLSQSSARARRMAVWAWRPGTETDRLGMPLIETVTYPEFKNPDEVREGADYIRFLNRSTGKVRSSSFRVSRSGFPE